jgi:cytochrome c
VSRLGRPLFLAAALLIGSSQEVQADPARGERVFQRCYACHSVKPEESNLPGPNLGGAFGRRAGSLAGFDFSPAMIEAGLRRHIVWTRKTLDAFLADPERLVPGTTMAMPGLSKADERRDLIDYLEKAARAARAAPGKSRERVTR